MNHPKIIFAFAVNDSNKFEAKHFGDVDKYLIYEYYNESFNLLSHQTNTSKDLDEKKLDESIEKGNSIVKLLTDHKVQVLVSLQFGQNIKMINQHFIPVAIHDPNTEEIFKILLKNMKWIIDELEINPPEFRLFSINTGVLKSSIK
ncbi:MAG: NifB/NifX family molybdenum-iron cluster-binding protein [Labilibaculum antarcticum]